MPRENANGARAKSGARTVPVAPELIRLYADYLHEEYGGIDSDYVFVNVWAEPKGQAWSYPAAYDLVLRLRARTGLDFDPHWLRHGAATRWLRDGVSIEVVSKLLGHSSVTTTSAVYGNPRELHRMSEVWTVCRVRRLPESVLAGRATRCLAWVLASASR